MAQKSWRQRGGAGGCTVENWGGVESKRGGHPDTWVLWGGSMSPPIPPKVQKS